MLRFSTVVRLARTCEPAALIARPATIRHLNTVSSPEESLSQGGESNKVVEYREEPSSFLEQPDQASSSFSPTPTQSLIHSQGSIFSAAILSGSPLELQSRSVRIYRPSKPATQSGDWHGHHWRLDWDILSKGHRWENPLMGWQSSADFVQGTHLSFKSKEDAIRFAEKHGYEYFVHEPKTRKFVPKAYANNFLWSDKKLKHIRTK